MEMQTMKPDSLSLPCDVILDIFSWLPAKSLNRFRCLSKRFFSYLSTPYFHQLHLQKSSKSPFSVSLTLLDESHYVDAIELNQHVRKQIRLSITDHEGRQTITEFVREIEIDGWKNIFVLPSHHNLICVVTVNHIYVCNPSKQEFVELPEGSNFKSLANMVGFGYIPSKDEYKVVRCFLQQIGMEEENEFRLGCEILTISSNCGSNNRIESSSAWRVLEGGCPHFIEETTKPALVKGSLHWKIHWFWGRGEDDEEDIGGEEEIMSFDLEKEKFWTLPAPQCVRICPQTVKLVELRENLWLTHFDYNTRPHVMEMWVLKDFDKFTWTKEYSINLITIMKNFGDEETTFVMNIRNDDELLIRMDLGRQVYFNTKTKILTDLGAPESDNRFQFCYFKDVFSFHHN